MNQKRITLLADFFYSSNSCEDVPLRIMVSTGQFGGYDLESKNDFIKLMRVLNHSGDLKRDLRRFLSSLDDGEA